MSSNLFSTIYALIMAIVIVAILWSGIMYWAEMGTEIGKRHQKGMLLGAVTGLFGLMLLLGVVHWVLGLIGL